MNKPKNDSQGQKASFSQDDFAHALEKYEYNFNKGQTVRGKIVELSPEGSYIDIGAKSLAFMPAKETPAESLPLNEEMDFLIIRQENEEGQLTLSRRQLILEQAWASLSEKFSEQALVQMRITGVNKGGVTGEIEGLQGFIPRSHLIEKDNLESLVGELITAHLLEVNQDNRKLVLSQKKLAHASAVQNFSKGELVEGKVVKIQPYGVFVELQGVTGLLHITQISGKRIESVESIFKLGELIKVVITEIDEGKNRISLSTKILENYPGEIVEQKQELMNTASDRLEKAQKKLSE